MRAGRLRHQIVILDPIDNTDDRGDAQVTYKPRSYAVPGSIEPLTGRELWYAQQMRADITHKVTMRGAQGVTDRHRLLWSGRYWECGPALSPEERGRELIITAFEIKQQPK